MELTTLGRPWSWLYNLAGRLGGRKDGIRIIGGSRGPTALLAARRPGKPKWQGGVLCVRLSWAEAFTALGLALGLVASLALLVFTLLQGKRGK